MANPFEVAVDSRGRIDHYVPAEHPEVSIFPEGMAEVLDGGERVLFHNREYDLTETGNLIYTDVEVPAGVNLGHGVRLDEGVKFVRIWADPEDPSDDVQIADRARVKGTEIHEGVTIDDHALVLGRVIGHHTFIGSYARVGIGTRLDTDVVVGDTAKIDVECLISSHVTVGENARLGFNTRAGRWADIGPRARVGKFGGAGSRGVDKGGPLILPGQIVAASEKIAA